MIFFFPMLLELLEQAAQPVQRVAVQAGGMTDEVKLAVTVGASLLLAAIVAVFYLGRKVGNFSATVTAFKEQVRSFEEATREATRLGEKWNSDLLAALREVDERVTDALMRINELEHKKREEKDIPERLRELEEWRLDHVARHEERARVYGSQRNAVSEDGAPALDGLFEASGRKDGGDDR